MPFHPFCSQGQNEQNAANAFRTNHSYSRMVDKKNAPLCLPLLLYSACASKETKCHGREKRGHVLHGIAA